MKFTMTVESGNEAMVEDPGTAMAEILQLVAERTVEGNTAGLVKDANGNHVGTWVLDYSL